MSTPSDAFTLPLQKYFTKIKKHILILIIYIGICWFIIVYDTLVSGKPYDLHNWGIIPRTVRGIAGIPLMPFIHIDVNHLIANSLAILFLGILMLLKSIKEFIITTISTIFLGGFLVWVFARNFNGSATLVHLGAGGLLLGWFGYLISSVFFMKKKDFKSIVITIICGFFYGGYAFTVIPSDPRISWESHLFGLIVGVITALVYYRIYPDYVEDIEKFVEEKIKGKKK